MKPSIITIIGPSCAGKDTLMRQLYWEFSNGELLYRFPDVYYIISSTTRPPRKGEEDHRDYHFISDEFFQEKIDDNKMLEWTEFKGWKYGTDKKSVCLNPNAINIGVFNLIGLKNLSNNSVFNIIPIYINVNWRERLRRSVKREGHLTFEMLRRLYADYLDFKNADEILSKYDNLLKYSNGYDIDDVMDDILGKFK